MPFMEDRGGRREARKLATRRALREAASTLFAQHGVEATTVRQIAAAAGVTERTFYRYFAGKEELIAGRAQEWIEALHDAVAERPAEEGPLSAVERAMSALAREAGERGSEGVWLFGGAARPLLRVSARPLIRVERAITSALLSRGGGSPAEEERFQAELLARVAVAVLRTALLSHRRFGDEGEASPGIEALIGAGFAALRGLAS
jgi:AcrR family transcriptional regulator